MEIINNKLNIGYKSAEELAKKYGTPLYVYEEEDIKKKYYNLINNIKYKKLKIYYACKANTNIEILKIIKELGCSIETVSRGEIEIVLETGFIPENIIFTCSNIEEDEIKFIIEKKIIPNLDSLGQIKKYGELNPDASISIRINQGIGAGHHNHVITGGPESKFGIYPEQLEEAKQIAEKYNLKIIGLHQHIGSNILDENIFIEAMKLLLKTAEEIKDLEFLDFGGGFGIAYRPEEKELNMEKLGKKITDLLLEFSNRYGKNIIIAFEPGRYLISESGILLAKVTDIKKTLHKKFIGINSGFNHLIRPIMYNSYHKIINASNVEGKKEIVSIAGNICESGDLFASDREITKFNEGDIAAILNVGAYGYSMSSNYNSRKKPSEVLVGKNYDKLIRKRE